MSSSPCCADFKFPVHQNDAMGFQNKTSDLSSPIGALSMGSPLMATEGADYFAMKAPWLAPVVSPSFNQPSKPTIHKAAANSISSLTSETTLVEGNTSGFSDFTTSTDTLVPDLATSSPKSRRNVLLLRLALSHRSSLKTHAVGASSARPYDCFPKIDEELPNQMSQSAVDSRFAFNRHLPTDDTESAGFSFKTENLNVKAGSTTPSEPLIKPVFPKLRKQTTLPNLFPQHDMTFINTIQNEQAKRCLYKAPPENMRDAIVGLSPTIKYLTAPEVATLLGSCHIDPRSKLPSVFVIDVRSFADFVKGNVCGSINVCPPLTLLRRSTFNWAKCVNSLPNYERLINLNYLHFNNKNVHLKTVFDDTKTGLHGLPPILIYDNNNYSANLYHMCKKLVDHSCWDAVSAPPIYLLDGPFVDFSSQYGHLISCRKSEPIDLSTLEVTTLLESPSGSNDSILEHRLETSGKAHINAPRSSSISGLPSISFDTSTPSVSNFSLPQNLPQKTFKIRHNEEVFDLTASPKMDTLASKLTSSELDLLPKWLKEKICHPDRIKEEFNKLEVCEKLRLNNALSLQSKPELITPGGSMEVSPIINCGLDYGHKNRYKDILLYDHSRVKLHHNCDQLSEANCDYINASYLDPTSEFMDLTVQGKESREQLMKELKIIATQGPLPETTGDFWKCVVDQQCLLIVSLTEEYEGGLKKCSAYWTPGVYNSGQSVVKVLVRKVEAFDHFVLRSFTVAVGEIQRYVLQVQLNQWQDMNVTVDPRDILPLILLKEHILSEIKPHSGYPTITHCSAGCGRTGVFCAVDSLIGLLRTNNNQCELPYDPVYSLVNSLRRQRILMVQTMRQYIMIYDVLVQYALFGNKVKSMGELDIVKDFLKVLGK